MLILAHNSLKEYIVGSTVQLTLQTVQCTARVKCTHKSKTIDYCGLYTSLKTYIVHTFYKQKWQIIKTENMVLWGPRNL